MKFSSSLIIAVASISATVSAYGSIWARDFNELDLFTRDYDEDDTFEIFSRSADSLDDDELYIVARGLVSKLQARQSGRSRSSSSSSSSSSGLFAIRPGGGGGAPSSPAGFSPISPTRNEPHFTRTGAYTLDNNGGRRHSTGSSTAFGSSGGSSGGRRNSV